MYLCEIHVDEKKHIKSKLRSTHRSLDLFISLKHTLNYMYIMLRLRQKQEKSHNMLVFLFPSITTWARLH